MANSTHQKCMITVKIINLIFFIQNIFCSIRRNFPHAFWNFSQRIYVSKIWYSRVWNQPIDGGEMLSLGEFLIETPEHLDDTKCCWGDGIWEVTTRRRDGSYNGNGTLSVGVTEALDATGTFVEGGQPRAQVSGITAVGRHLSQTTWKNNTFVSLLSLLMVVFTIILKISP